MINNENPSVSQPSPVSVPKASSGVMGKRVVAALIDALVLLIILIIAVAAFGKVQKTQVAPNIPITCQASDVSCNLQQSEQQTNQANPSHFSFSTTVNGNQTTHYLSNSIAYALFAIYVAYLILTEWFFGFTLGKRITGVKVTKDDGSKLNFTSSLLRNIFRLVDWLPLFYLLGFIVAISNGNNKRVGDFVAGTRVVRSAMGEV